MIGRLAALVLIVLPYTLLLLPAQLFILWLRLPPWPVLPRVFHRLLCLALGLRVTVIGAPCRPALLVANHVSWLDIPAIGAHVEASFLAKAEIAAAPLVGPLTRLQRTLFVDRRRRAGAAAARAAIAARLGEGGSVVVFAEATSGPGTHVLPFRSALLAAPPPAVLQPMAIAYRSVSGLPIPRSARTRLAWIGDMGPFDNFFEILASGPKEVVIAFAPPLAPGTDRKQAARRAEGDIRALVFALNRGRPLPKLMERCKPTP